MTHDVNDLTPKQHLALEALLRTGSINGAAKAANVTRQTINKWLKLPAFQAAYRDARRRLVDRAVIQLQRHSEAASIRLLGLLTDKNVPHATVLAACKTVLELALHAVEIDDFEARIAALEQEASHA